MMASPTELSLECKPQSYSMLLKSFGGDVINNPTDQQATQKLQDYLTRLEEERLKIDAFKRELPLCMQLLTQAMEVSRQQLQSCRSNNEGTRPVLEEFMPIKQSNMEGSDQKQTNTSDKENWMVSAQLWSQAGDPNKQQSSILPKSEADHNTFNNVGNCPKLGLDNKQRNGGAFLPFTKERSLIPNNSSIMTLPDLALVSNDREMEEKKCTDSENGMSDNSNKISNVMVGKAVDSQSPTNTTTTPATPTSSQTHRKARRCWSPDLHRRFVNALQMLGGSQVATPKQIRELMKVDGLTNDEVKSHLQKYRLHTRRPSPSPQTAGAPAPQLVVLGGIWVPPEYATAAAAAHGGPPTIYSTHPSTQVSSHYCSPTVPSDFYPQPSSAPQALHLSAIHHHQHPQLHVYKTASHTQTTHSSPESDGHGAGNRSESMEDGKSESSSWKGESGGENGGDQRNKLAALRVEDGESMNGSEITLKF